MYGAPSDLTSQDSVQSFPLQLPTLKGINIPPLKPSPALSLVEPPLAVSPLLARHSVQRMDNGGHRSQTYGAILHSVGHKHSRSLEIHIDTPACGPASSLDSAVSETSLLPRSEQSDACPEVSSSLAGIYISQSSRKNPCSGIAANSVAQCISAFPPMTTALDSPSSDIGSEEGAESEDDADSEDVWDLIPYDISWGPTYYGYREGTLPGPEGKCIFLRSPTPLKYQRTEQACEKCRERKAKCSGSRPSCARCAARGLICVYASDSKQVRPNSSISEKVCQPVDVHSAQTAKLVDIDYQGRARVRRNTDCGSHAPRVDIQSKGTELRRRHSTIGSSRSASHTPGHGLRAHREHRVARASMESKAARGFLGALLDPLITFPENGAEGDDHPVCESNRGSYQTTDSIGTQTTLSSSEGSYAIRLVQASPPGVHDRQEMQTVAKSEVPFSGNTPGMPSFASNLTDGGLMTTYQGLCNLDRFRSSGLTYSDGYAHQEPWHDCGIEDRSMLTIGGEGSFDVPGGEFDYDTLGASSPAAMRSGGCWPCDGTAQTKLGLEGYSMEVDAPYIAVPNHAPDFYEFDQNDDMKAWFPSENC